MHRKRPLHARLTRMKFLRCKRTLSRWRLRRMLFGLSLRVMMERGRFCATRRLCEHSEALASALRNGVRSSYTYPASKPSLPRSFDARSSPLASHRRSDSRNSSDYKFIPNHNTMTLPTPLRQHDNPKNHPHHSSKRKEPPISRPRAGCAVDPHAQGAKT